jgi:hypothetical protein
MTVKKLLLVMAAGALLLLQFGDCMSALTSHQQSMQCCGSMPCTPVNHGQDCCKKMASAQVPNMLPAKHASLRGPTVGTIEYPEMLEIIRSTPALPVTVSAQQHSPPDLYTLNVSFLI